MIYIPWLVFSAAIIWMIRRGYKDKAEFLGRKAELKEVVEGHAVKVGSVSHASSQGQASELAGALAGDSKTRIQGFQPHQGRS